MLAEEALKLKDIFLNGCTGHGHCNDFVCECFDRYHGEDCRHTFARPAGAEPLGGGGGGSEGAGRILPIGTAGHCNLTAKNFSRVVGREKLLVVVFSSKQCHKCIVYEPAYAAAAAALRETLNVSLARADADKFRNEVRSPRSAK